MKMNRKEYEKQKWMSRFEDIVNELAPQHRGKIEWVSAVYFHGVNLTPEEAAQRYISSR